jgi:NAD(P)-dependent dehydrogenase (short-subunit alcohol dehydrogenase family)
LQSGRVAAVTGGASGIGFALASAAAEAGLDVLLADIDAEALAASSRRLEQGGATVRTLAGDVADPGFAEQFADLAFGMGSVQLLCSNAGIVVSGMSWEISQQQWDRVIGVNLMATVHLFRAFIPRLIESAQPARLLVTGSMASVTARAGIAPYVTAKHGLLGLAETTDQEFKSLGLDLGVTILMPGLVLTGMATEAPPGGLSAADVADIALAAVAHDQLFAFTHPDRVPEVARRFNSIVTSEIRSD